MKNNIHTDQASPCWNVGSLSDSRARGPQFNTWSCHNTFISPATNQRRAVVSYWQKCVHKVLVNHLWGLSLPRKSVVKSTDLPDMTLAVYRGCKTTKHHNNTNYQMKICTCILQDVPIWPTSVLPTPTSPTVSNDFIPDSPTQRKFSCFWFLIVLNSFINLYMYLLFFSFFSFVINSICILTSNIDWLKCYKSIISSNY